MDPITLRLTNCFETVFPDLPVAEIPAASQATVAAWDSVAAITLVNVIEEEFGIEMDLDQLADLDSFRRVHDYLSRATQAS
jgi:acyl carrier protein